MVLVARRNERSVNDLALWLQKAGVEVIEMEKVGIRLRRISRIACPMRWPSAPMSPCYSMVMTFHKLTLQVISLSSLPGRVEARC